MDALVHFNISKAINTVVPVLESQEAVAGAFLFGSVLGHCRPDSDIDVGLSLISDQAFSEKAGSLLLEDILESLPRIDRRPYDLVILNQVSTLFAFRMISQGRKIYTCDPQVISDFVEFVCRRRREDCPRYRCALEAIVRDE